MNIMGLKIKKYNLFIYGVFALLLILTFTNPSEKKLISKIQTEKYLEGEKVIERTKNGIVFSVYKVYFNYTNAENNNTKEYLGVFNRFYLLSEKVN